MNNKILILFLCLCTLPCTAQDPGRWSAELAGSAGVFTGPRYSVGVQGGYDVLRIEGFRVGLGAGIRLCQPLHSRYMMGGSNYYDAGGQLLLPLFLRLSWTPTLAGKAVHPYYRFDIGYDFHLSWLPHSDTGGYVNGFFFEPQLGLRFGKRFFASVGCWLISASYSERAVSKTGTSDHEMYSFKDNRLTPSVSVHFGICL